MDITTIEDDDVMPEPPHCKCMWLLGDTIFQIRLLGSEAINTSDMCQAAKDIAWQFHRLFKLVKDA